MEFRNSNEKGARIKTHAPGPEFTRLLTSGCQEGLFICGHGGASGRPDHKSLDDNRDDRASQDGQPNVDGVRPTDLVHASRDPDDMDPDPNQSGRGEAPNRDPSSVHHSTGCCC